MKETSFKAGVIGGVFTFLALFATTSKASINESAATNGDYKINRGRLHAMYVAYYILKHKLIGEAMDEYLAKVIKEWKSLETQGWCGYSKMYSGEKYFRERVDSLIDTYSDEEIVCADRPEA